jgi:hypothetical protein
VKSRLKLPQQALPDYTNYAFQQLPTRCSRADLAELQTRHSTMRPSALQDFYRSTPSYAGSALGRFSGSAKVIQELVAAWKELRMFR